MDSTTGPDVFWKLGTARVGDRILVSFDGGATIGFVVQSVGTFPQAQFPSDQVYGGPGTEAELRLITCGGRYDHAEGAYQDNVVVLEVVPKSVELRWRPGDLQAALTVSS